MDKKLLLIGSICLLLNACGGKYLGVAIKGKYDDWVADGIKDPDSKNRYFVGDAHDVNQRNCQEKANNVAKARALEELNSSISQTVSSMDETADGESIEKAITKVKNTLNGSLASLQNHRVFETFDKSENMFWCYTLKSMPIETYTKLQKESVKKMMKEFKIPAEKLDEVLEKQN